jgi:NitT/TauT family transport system ATP-binding protein
MNLQELLLRVWERERRTVIFVTHSVDEAVFLSDKVAVFSGRPARCREVVIIDLPRPRRWAALQSSPRMAEFKERLFALVQGQVPGEAPLASPGA